MLFLLNDVVLNLRSEGLRIPLSQEVLANLSLDSITRLGAEMFAANPALQRTDPVRAEKLAMLIVAKWPTINAALFVAPSLHCKASQVASRYADLAIDVISGLNRRQNEGSLTAARVDEAVWRRLAA